MPRSPERAEPRPSPVARRSIQDAIAAAARHPAAAWTALASCFAFGIALQLSQPIHHDVGWLLVATRHLLRGARIYDEDVVEINPPTILWILAPALALARALGASEIAGVRAWAFASAAGSLALCAAVLRRALGPERAPLRRWTLAALAFAFLVPLHRQFAQREHWMALLLLPYVLVLGARGSGASPGRALAVASGSLAAVALALKPHQLLVPALLELHLALRRRSARALLRPETAALAVVGTAFVAAVAAFTPAYLTRVLPLAADVYGAFQRPRVELLRPAQLVLLLLSGLAVLRVRGDPARAELARSCWLAGAGAWLAHLVQATGWPYHLIPFETAALAALAIALAPDRAARLPGRPVPALAAAGLGAVVATALALAPPFGAIATLRSGGAWRRGEESGIVGELADLLREHGAGGPVVFLSTRLEWGFPAVNYAGVDWSSRFGWLWPLPAVIRARATGADPAPERLAAIERYVAASLVEDFERAPPQLVFVDAPARAFGTGGKPVDLLETLLRDPGFARIWRGYEPFGRAGPYRIHRPRAAAGRSREVEPPASPPAISWGRSDQESGAGP